MSSVCSIHALDWQYIHAYSKLIVDCMFNFICHTNPCVRLYEKIGKHTHTLFITTSNLFWANWQLPT